MKATAEFINTKQYEVKLSIQMTAGQWAVVSKALETGKEGYYGAAWELLKEIERTLEGLNRQVEFLTTDDSPLEETPTHYLNKK